MERRSDARKRSVRIELVDLTGTVTEPNPPGFDRRASRRSLGAGFLAAAGLCVVVALWLSARPDGGTDAARDPIAGPAVDEGSSLENLVRALEAQDPALPFPTTPDRLVRVADTWLGLRESPTGEGHTEVVVSSDGVLWRWGEAVGLPVEGQVIRLQESDGVLQAIHTTPSDDGSEVSVHRSDDGETWVELGRWGVKGHPVRASFRSNRWVVLSPRRSTSGGLTDENATIVTTATMSQPEPPFWLEIHPEQFVSSFAATADGFVATIERSTEYENDGSGNDAPDLWLGQWSAREGLVEARGLPSAVDDAHRRFVDAGDRGIFFVDGTRIYRSDRSGVSWEPAVDFDSVPDARDGLAISPVLLGEGFVITDTSGPPDSVIVSLDGSTWSIHPVRHGERDLTPLLVAGDTLYLVGLRGDAWELIRLGLAPDEVVEGDVAMLEISHPDGEWTPPVFAANPEPGRGFVSLESDTGETRLVESLDGFDITLSTGTNLPFGFVPSELQAVGSGYAVLGQIALVEDAIFVSDDGIEWAALEMALPRDATSIHVVAFDRLEKRTVLVGELGWAEDSARAEPVTLSITDAGSTVEIAPLPCLPREESCEILSVELTPDGLVAAHSIGASSGLSIWADGAGWRQLAPVDGGFPTSRIASFGDGIWYLGRERIMVSGDGGATFNTWHDAPPTVGGEFVEIATNGAVSLYDDGDNLWATTGSSWVRYELEGVEHGDVLAMTTEAALLRGVGPDGPVLVRLAMP